MRRRPIIVSLLSTINAAAILPRDIVFSTDERSATFAQSFGVPDELTIVNAGVTRWLSGGESHYIFGNINNYGTIVFSQSDYLRDNPDASGLFVLWQGYDMLNGHLTNAPGAVISLNDFEAVSPATYAWDIQGFTNWGSIQWCSGGGEGGDYELVCGEDCYNYGLIDFAGHSDTYTVNALWLNSVLAPPDTTVSHNIYNYGAVRISRVLYKAAQNIQGDGCWVIGFKGTLFMDDGAGHYNNPNGGPTWPNQNIHFLDNTGILHMERQVFSINPNFGPTLYGFGSGNMIELHGQQSTLSYDSDTGILHLAFYSGDSLNLKLGTGYDSSGFRVVKFFRLYYGFTSQIFYDASAPNSPPSICRVTADQCADPTATVVIRATTTTLTTTTATTATTELAPPPTTTATSTEDSPFPLATTTTEEGPLPTTTPTADGTCETVKRPVATVTLYVD